jgi:hypothetical protein
MREGRSTIPGCQLQSIGYVQRMGPEDQWQEYALDVLEYQQKGIVEPSGRFPRSETTYERSSDSSFGFQTIPTSHVLEARERHSFERAIYVPMFLRPEETQAAAIEFTSARDDQPWRSSAGTVGSPPPRLYRATIFTRSRYRSGGALGCLFRMDPLSQRVRQSFSLRNSHERQVKSKQYPEMRLGGGRKGRCNVCENKMALSLYVTRILRRNANQIYHGEVIECLA